MVKDLVNIIKDVCLRHKGCYTFRYKNKAFFNAQNNYRTFQCYLDTIQHYDLNITTNIFKGEVNLWILAQPQQNGKTVLDIQDEAFAIAVDVLGYLDNMPEYKGVLSLYDYSINTISEYTDDNSAGVHISIVLEMPSPLNLCEYEDNFDDEPHTEPEEPEIDIDVATPSEELEIKTIKLPKRKC